MNTIPVACHRSSWWSVPPRRARSRSRCEEKYRVYLARAPAAAPGSSNTSRSSATNQNSSRYTTRSTVRL